MWNGLRYKPSLYQTVVLSDIACNHEFFSIINLVFPYFKLFFQLFYSFSSLDGNTFDLLFMFLFFCVGAEITSLMSISDGSDPYLFCRKMEKTRSLKEEMDGKVFIFRQSRHPFPLMINMIKILFPICTLIWRANSYVSRQGKV